jgi:hypothetical protein
MVSFCFCQIDGQLMSSNVTVRTMSNLKGEMLPIPVDDTLKDLRGWVCGTEAIGLLSHYLTFYDISKERDFSTFISNVTELGMDPIWGSLLSTCPCCYGW